MPGTTVIAATLAGLLAVGGVASAPFERWAYRGGARASRKRIGYAATILYLWTLTTAAIWSCGWMPLLVSPVPSAAWLPAPAVVTSFLFAPLGAFFLVALLPFFRSLRGPRWRRAYQAAIRREFAGIPGIVPNDAAERTFWILLSLTAGICEEILFRGFLIRFLHEGPLALPVLGALAISCLCFGLGHLYQGSKGALSSTVAGFGFGVLFLLSGSLVPGIVLHALIDLQMAYVMRPISGEPAALPEPA